MTHIFARVERTDDKWVDSDVLLPLSQASLGILVMDLLAKVLPSL